MIVNPDSPRYCAYLLRCWQEQGESRLGAATWRFSLDDPHSAERYGFATFDALIAFLQEAVSGEVFSAQGGAAGE